MRNKKLTLAIGLICVCLAVVAVYKIIDMAGFFENTKIISKTRRISSDSNSATDQVTLTWDKDPNATAYNVYWRASPGVTKRNGEKISDVKNPVTVKGLKRGTTYYFVVTAVSEFGESKESEELSYTVGR